MLSGVDQCRMAAQVLLFAVRGPPVAVPVGDVCLETAMPLRIAVLSRIAAVNAHRKFGAEAFQEPGNVIRDHAILLDAADRAMNGSGETPRNSQPLSRQTPSGSHDLQNAAMARWCSLRRIVAFLW